jgi:hypothetical protein
MNLLTSIVEPVLFPFGGGPSSHHKPHPKPPPPTPTRDFQTTCHSHDMLYDDFCYDQCQLPANKTACDTQTQLACDNLNSFTNEKLCTEWCRNNTSKCRTGIGAYCSNKKNLFSDPLCKQFCNDYPQQCNTTKQTLCNTSKHINSKQCRVWCHSNMGFCDDAMTTLCADAQNKTDPRCTCMLSKAKRNPLCIDANCSKTGYATTSMIQGKSGGCKMVDCKQYAILKNVKVGGNIKFMPKFEEKCSITGNTKKNKTTTNKTTTNNTTQNTSSPQNKTTSKNKIEEDKKKIVKKKKDHTVLIIVSVASIIIVIIILFAIASK